ncbi:MAG: cadherin repeat domain-containing protein [Limisphaerales bacterium]
MKVSQALALALIGSALLEHNSTAYPYHVAIMEVTWSGAPLGNSATAVGTIAISESDVPQATEEPVIFSPLPSWLVNLSVTVNGATSGNGTFARENFHSLVWDTAGGYLHFTNEVVGFLTQQEPWGTSYSGSAGNFNLLGEGDAPTGTSWFTLTTAGGDSMVLTSFKRVSENWAPTNIWLSNTKVKDASPIGTVVGILSAGDRDPEDSHTFVFSNHFGEIDNNSFVIEGNQLKTASVINRSEKDLYWVRVRATDRIGLSHDRILGINVDVQTPAAGKYTGLFHEPGEEKYYQNDSAGFVTLSISSKFGVSGKLFIEGNSVPFSGKLDVDGTATLNVSRLKWGKGDLVMELALDLNDTGELTGTLHGESWTSTLKANKSIYSKLDKAPEALVGRYTTVLNTGRSPGYGLLTLDAQGKIKLVGGMPDTVNTKCSGHLSKNREWPFYSALYPHKRTVAGRTFVEHRGAALGWLTFGNSYVEGDIRWVTDGTISSAFTYDIYPYAERYSPGPTSSPVLGTSSYVLDILRGDIVAVGFFKDNNVFSISDNPAGVSLSVAPKTGLMKGAFRHPGIPGTTTKFKGVVFPSFKEGVGVFHGIDEPGSVHLRQGW